MERMTKEDYAQHSLEKGERYPFDAPDYWNKDPDSYKKYPPKDWAHRAARGVLFDLQDRHGTKDGFLGVDEDVRKVIVDDLAEIIRQAHKDDFSAARTAIQQDMAKLNERVDKALEEKQRYLATVEEINKTANAILRGIKAPQFDREALKLAIAIMNRESDPEEMIFGETALIPVFKYLSNHLLALSRRSTEQEGCGE